MKRLLFGVPLFLVLFSITTMFSYNDMRPADGPLQVGFPMTFFALPSGFGFYPDGIHASWYIIALVIDIAVVSVVVSLIIIIFSKKYKKI